jgi:hypothetical protein
MRAHASPWNELKLLEMKKMWRGRGEMNLKGGEREKREKREKMVSREVTPDTREVTFQEVDASP